MHTHMVYMYVEYFAYEVHTSPVKAHAIKNIPTIASVAKSAIGALQCSLLNVRNTHAPTHTPSFSSVTGTYMYKTEFVYMYKYMHTHTHTLIHCSQYTAYK